MRHILAMHRRMVTDGTMRKHLDHQGSIAFAPIALQEMARGFCDLADLLAITLGPNRGPIWHANGNTVEMLTTSGIVARRVVEVADRLRNTGAMQLRHLVWRVHETYGDGGATAAVIARAMVERAITLIGAGIDPMTLRRGMDASLPVAIAALEDQRQPVAPATTSHLINSILSYPDISEVLAEMIDVLGLEAGIHLDVIAHPHLDRVYVDGKYWKCVPAPSHPIGNSTLVLNAPIMLVADDEVLEPDDLVQMLETIATGRPRRPLVIVGAKLGSEAQDLLNRNSARGTIIAYTVSPRMTGAERHQVLTDIALATGAELVSTLRGYAPAALQPSWLGTARQIILKRDGMIVSGGSGDQSEIQRRIADIRTKLLHARDRDHATMLRERLASLTDGSGILQIGGLTDAERDEKRRHVERALRILPEIIGSGTVPGGGLALLACLPAVHHHASLGRDDRRLGADIIAAGLSAPFLQLVANSGASSPPVVLHRVTESNGVLAFDALHGTIVPADQLGTSDSLSVVQGTLRMATSAVSELIATGVAILPKEGRRQVSANP